MSDKVSESFEKRRRHRDVFNETTELIEELRAMGTGLGQWIGVLGRHTAEPRVVEIGQEAAKAGDTELAALCAVRLLLEAFSDSAKHGFSVADELAELPGSMGRKGGQNKAGVLTKRARDEYSAARAWIELEARNDVKEWTLRDVAKTAGLPHRRVKSFGWALIQRRAHELRNSRADSGGPSA